MFGRREHGDDGVKARGGCHFSWGCAGDGALLGEIVDSFKVSVADEESVACSKEVLGHVIAHGANAKEADQVFCCCFASHGGGNTVLVLPAGSLSLARRGRIVGWVRDCLGFGFGATYFVSDVL